MSIANCISPELMHLYLAGWLDDPASDSVEEHLRCCMTCEAKIARMETEPQSFAEHFERRVAAKMGDTELPETPSSDVLAYAIRQSKRLCEPESSSESENEDCATSPQSMPEFIGPYKVVHFVGHGGMGAVYLAHHPQLDRQVAIKVLQAKSFRNDHYAARFKREMRTAGQLRHPSIIQATDAGQADGVHYLVMEYVDGLDLSRIVRSVGTMRIPDACEIMRQVALGLSHAHALGIVHRDVKPSNIMLSKNGEAKVMDFGLAQVSLWGEASAELTTVGQLMGTLDYMAPEQAEHAEGVDYRADLYSLGATLFRLLCGRPPLMASPDLSPLAKLRLLSNQQPPRLDTLCQEAPKELVDLVARLLARAPNERPASAAHVAEELLPFCTQPALEVLAKTAMEKLANQEILQTVHASKLRGEPLNTGTVPPSRRGDWGAVGWYIALAAMIPLLWFGITIALDWNKGQLIIESDSANVRVRVLQNGKEHQNLSIAPGAKATKLFAGKYEIEIDGENPLLRVDPARIEIMSGETVVAQIRQSTKRLEASLGIKGTGGSLDFSTITSQSNERIYDGKPISVWLNEFDRETNHVRVKEALTALHALANDSNKTEIVEKIWKALPEKPGNIDAALSVINSNCERTKFSRRFTQELIKHQENTQLMLDMLNWVFRWRNKTAHNEDQDFQSILDVVRKLVHDIQTSRGAVEQIVHLLIAQLELQSSDSKHIESILMEITALTPQDWLKTAIPYSSISSVGYGNVLQTKALDAIIDSSSSVDLLVNALLALSKVDALKNKGQVLESISRQEDLATALRRRLMDLIRDENQLFKDHFVEPMKSHNMVTHLIRNVFVQIDGPKGLCLGAEFCHVAIKNGLGDNLRDEISQVQELVFNKVLELTYLLATSNPPSTPQSILVSWPNPSKHISITAQNNRMDVSETTDQHWVAYSMLNDLIQYKDAEGREKWINKLDPWNNAITAPTMPSGNQGSDVDHRLLRWAEWRIKRLDTNRDGFLTPDESPEISFQKFDFNRDGKLDASEYARMYAVR